MLSPIGVVRKVFFNKIVIEIDDMKKLNQNYKGDIYSCEGLDTFISYFKYNIIKLFIYF